MARMLPDLPLIWFDGGMGSLLMRSGMEPGMRSDQMNETRPQAVESIHQAYVDAGSGLLCTNTFSLSSVVSGMRDDELQTSVNAAVNIARRAAGTRAMVGLDVGPTGEFMEPYGDLTYEAAYERFRRLTVCGEKAGVDYVCIETMSAADELKAAVLAAAENTGLGILATMTFREDGRTFTGFSVEEFAELANGLPLLAAGVNCSSAPDRMLPAVTRLAAVLKKPLIVKLNAGLPDENGAYDVTPEAFAAAMLPYRTLGVRVLGGCCGTTPAYIAALRRAFESE